MEISNTEKEVKLYSYFIHQSVNKKKTKINKSEI
jgi:hypothetical protein